VRDFYAVWPDDGQRLATLEVALHVSYAYWEQTRAALE
jgi:hypothetical protein